MGKDRLPRIPKLCRRKDGRYYVTDPHLKRPVYFNSDDPLSEYEEWRQAYYERLRQLQKPVRPARLQPGQRVSVAELCSAYLDHAEQWYRKDGQETSEIGVLHMLIRRVLDMAGQKQANRLRATDVEAILERMIEDGLARRTINSLLRRLRTIARWGVRKEVLTGETLGRILSVPGLRAGRTQAREKPKVKPVELERVEKTLRELGLVHRAMVQVQLYSGMRPGEVCRLRADDIDRSAEPWQYRPLRYKTQHHHEEGDVSARRVFFGPQARAVLVPFLEACKEPSRPLFLSKKGRPIKVIDYHYYIDAACKRAGVLHWHANQLRHLAATAIRERYGVEGAQHILGHAKADVTQVYAERDEALAKRIAEDMG